MSTGERPIVHTTHRTPSIPRSRALLTLWLILGAVVLARRIPPAVYERDAGSTGSREVFTVDLNHASWQELTIIEGIGEALARKIVEARETSGGFDSLEDVMMVPGIPDRPFHRGRAYLKLSPTQ